MIRDVSPFVQVGLPGRIGRINGLFTVPGGVLSSDPASGHALPTALVTPAARRSSLAGMARSKVERGLDTRLLMSPVSAPCPLALSTLRRWPVLTPQVLAGLCLGVCPVA